VKIPLDSRRHSGNVEGMKTKITCTDTHIVCNQGPLEDVMSFAASEQEANEQLREWMAENPALQLRVAPIQEYYDQLEEDPNSCGKDPLPEDADCMSAPDREDTYREDVVHGESVWGF
jgi:hypothetical protein